MRSIVAVVAVLALSACSAPALSLQSYGLDTTQQTGPVSLESLLDLIRNSPRYREDQPIQVTRTSGGLSGRFVTTQEGGTTYEEYWQARGDDSPSEPGRALYVDGNLYLQGSHYNGLLMSTGGSGVTGGKWNKYLPSRLDKLGNSPRDDTVSQLISDDPTLSMFTDAEDVEFQGRFQDNLGHELLGFTYTFEAAGIYRSDSTVMIGSVALEPDGTPLRIITSQEDSGEPSSVYTFSYPDQFDRPEVPDSDQIDETVG